MDKEQRKREPWNMADYRQVKVESREEERHFVEWQSGISTSYRGRIYSQPKHEGPIFGGGQIGALEPKRAP